MGVEHPTRLVDAELQRWSQDKVLLFIAADKNPFSLQTYYEFLTLSYPRRMPAVICGVGSNPPLEIEKVPASVKIDGLIFFDIAPRRWATAGGRQVGPKLYFTPYQGVLSWRSFCP